MGNKIEGRALIDTGAFANVLSKSNYSDLMKLAPKFITKLDKPDLT